MIAFTDRDGHLTVSGTAREWGLFLNRLDRLTLARMSDGDKAREILVMASTVPFKGHAATKRPG
jgi:hypothetical protein